jgi:hypothetical protein
MKINIGFEFQTDQMSLVFPSRNDGKDYISHPAEHKEVQIIKKSNQKEMHLYGDRMSDKIAWRESYNMIRDWMIDGNHSLRLALSTGRSVDVPLDSVSEFILNDAEFVVTYFETEEISLDGLLSYIFTNVVRAAQEIHRAIKNNLSAASIEKSYLVKTRSKAATSPYKSLYCGKEFCLLSRINSETPIEFYIQTTVGVPIGSAWSVMMVLNEAYMAHPNAVQSQKTSIESMRVIDQSCKSSTIVDVLYKLFMYSVATRQNRKAAPFAIRHNFLQLLKLMTPSQYSAFVKRLPDEETIRYADRLYFQPVKDHDTPKKQQYYQAKLFQGSTTISFIPITLNTDHPLETMIFIECRYLNTILLSALKRTQTHDHLTLADLKSLPR